MNKFLSQAIKKAVSEYSPNIIEESNKDKRPDLFSLNENKSGLLSLFVLINSGLYSETAFLIA